MDEVLQIRMAGWAEMVRQRAESGMTITDWCRENHVSKNAYYYRLRQLRKAALAASDDKPQETSGTGEFAEVSGISYTSPSDVALRIKSGDTLIEVDNNASDGILRMLSEVISHVI